MSFTCTLHPNVQNNAGPTKSNYCCRSYQDQAEAAVRQNREARFQKLREAAVYLTTHKKPRACRCSGSCDTCKPWRDAERMITPKSVLEILDALAEAAKS